MPDDYISICATNIFLLNPQPWFGIVLQGSATIVPTVLLVPCRNCLTVSQAIDQHMSLSDAQVSVSLCFMPFRPLNDILRLIDPSWRPGSSLTD